MQWYLWKAEEICDPGSPGQKGIYSSTKSEIGKSYLSKVRTAGCDRYMEVSRGAFVNKVRSENNIVLVDNA